MLPPKSLAPNENGQWRCSKDGALLLEAKGYGSPLSPRLFLLGKGLYPERNPGRKGRTWQRWRHGVPWFGKTKEPDFIQPFELASRGEKLQRYGLPERVSISPGTTRAGIHCPACGTAWLVNVQEFFDYGAERA